MRLLFHLFSLPISFRIKIILVCSAGFIFSSAMYRCESNGKRKVQSLSDSVFRFGCWNVENLFDIKNDAWQDDDFTPQGKNRWTEDRYIQKLQNLSRVISEINPDVFGLEEVEKAGVISDLLHTEELKNSGYKFVHYNSTDERGIDVALIYKVNSAEIIISEPLKIDLPNGDKTRDLLYIQMKLKITGDTLHYFVNHWPSRREGKTESSVKRNIAAASLKYFIEKNIPDYRNIIICGDFNDNPADSSIRTVLGACRAGKDATCDLMNISALLNIKKEGTLKFAGRWDMFDQIMLGRNLWFPASQARVHFRHYSLKIYQPGYLCEQQGKNIGAPFRTYKGSQYMGGYSDHFPVFADLNYE